MRFSQANWITINDAARSLTCGHCDSTLDLSGESFGVLGFVRTVSKLARQHFSCPDPGRDYSAIEARRQQAIARDLAATIALEGEEIQRAIEGRASVVPFARGVTTTSDAPGMAPYLNPSAAHFEGIPARLKDPVLCLHCGENLTRSGRKICSPCQQRVGVTTCLNRIRERAAGAGGVN